MSRGVEIIYIILFIKFFVIRGQLLLEEGV